MTTQETNEIQETNETQEKPFISDFTGFGFVHVSHHHAKSVFDGMNFGELFGWGWTPLEAYLKSLKTIETVYESKEIVELASRDYSIVRVTPAAMAYLEYFGYDMYLTFEEVQFTVDEVGNPVTHVLDLKRFFPEVLEKINSHLGKVDLNNNMGNNNMEKSNFSAYEIKNSIDVTGWHFAAEFKGKIFGFGNTPAVAMKNAMESIKKTEMEKLEKKYHLSFFREALELEITIRPITPRAKKYIDTFGLDMENIGVIEVPLSITPKGYPFKYIVDLVNPKGIKIADILESITSE